MPINQDKPPPPLTPPDTDLRGQKYMPFHGANLFGSDSYVHFSDAELRAALNLWWVSWQGQIPAASLPDDDVILCNAAGLGRDLRSWRKVKEMALRGFVKCSDGRLYHRFLASIAIDSYALKLRAQKEKADGAERLRRHREKKACGTSTSENFECNAEETRYETPNETRYETGMCAVEEKRKEEKGKESKVRKNPRDLRSHPPTENVEPAPRVAADRGSRLPANWEPDSLDIELARSLGLNPQAVLERFRDYWVGVAGAKGRKSNWSATWRNWCRKDAEQRPANTRPPGMTKAQSEDAHIAQILARSALNHEEHAPPNTLLGFLE